MHACIVLVFESTKVITRHGCSTVWENMVSDVFAYFQQISGIFPNYDIDISNICSDYVQNISNILHCYFRIISEYFQFVTLICQTYFQIEVFAYKYACACTCICMYLQSVCLRSNIDVLQLFQKYDIDSSSWFPTYFQIMTLIFPTHV